TTEPAHHVRRARLVPGGPVRAAAPGGAGAARPDRHAGARRRRAGAAAARPVQRRQDRAELLRVPERGRLGPLLRLGARAGGPARLVAALVGTGGVAGHLRAVHGAGHALAAAVQPGAAGGRVAVGVPAAVALRTGAC